MMFNKADGPPPKQSMVDGNIEYNVLIQAY